MLVIQLEGERAQVHRRGGARGLGSCEPATQPALFRRPPCSLPTLVGPSDPRHPPLQHVCGDGGVVDIGGHAGARQPR